MTVVVVSIVKHIPGHFGSAGYWTRVMHEIDYRCGGCYFDNNKDVTTVKRGKL